MSQRVNLQSIFRLAFSRKSVAVFSTTRIAFAKKILTFSDWLRVSLVQKMRPKIVWKSNTLWLRPQKRDGNSGLMESGVQWNYDNLKYYDNFALRLWRKRALLFAIRVTETSLLLSVCTSCLACCDVTAPLTALASWEGLGLPPGIKMIAPISSMCTMKYVDLLR